MRSAFGRARGSPARRQKCRQVDETDPTRELRQHVGKVLDRIDTSEATRAEDREGDRCALVAGI
jgi:hypothetical protein